MHGVRADGRIVKLDGGDGTGLLRERLGAETADALMAAFDLFTDQMMLTGPTDADLPKLQALGYDPAAIVQAALPSRGAGTTWTDATGLSPAPELVPHRRGTCPVSVR